MKFKDNDDDPALNTKCIFWPLQSNAPDCTHFDSSLESVTLYVVMVTICVCVNAYKTYSDKHHNINCN